MARIKMPGNNNKKDSSSSSSQSSKRSPSLQVAPISKDKSGTKSSASTSFKSLSDHENEIEVQSNPSSTPQTNQPTVETKPAPQSPPPTTVQISEVLIGAIPITCKTVIKPIQCSQTAAKTPNEVPQVTITSTPKAKIVSSSKSTPIPPKTKKSKSVGTSKIRRSNRIASGRKPTIDETVYSISDNDSENTPSGSPKAKSAPILQTYSKRPSSSKTKTKPSKKSESSEEEDFMIRKLKKSAPLIHEDCQQSIEIFAKKKPILPGRVYNFDDLVNTSHDLTQFANPLGWTSLFNIRETHYPNLISAFNFNAVIPSDRNSIVSELKKARIKITEDLLGKLLDIPTTGHKLKGSKDKVTDNDMMIMYHMFNKIQLNLPYVMIQHMIYTIENESKRVTLPYGMFLTRVFNKFKVSFEGEEGKNSSTTFSLKNVGRMKFIGEIVEDHTIPDQGQKRKREEFEKETNLDLLAEVVTTQEDHPETVLPVSASEKGKESVSEKTTFIQFNPFVSLEFDNLGHNFENSENQFTTVLNDGFSTINNPVNTSIFSPLMTSPQTSFNTTSDSLRNFIQTPPEYAQMHQPVFTDAGPSLPSFPQNFASISSFCTNIPTNDSAAYQSSANIHSFNTKPSKKSKVEKDMAKLFQAIKINNTLMNYTIHEHQLFRTWLIAEFCPAMQNIL
ncbi:unnamed protein product [Trifolium pratense]|uniref:Uncharacterized protein n=1 Tax=Trifolium pratense TaxID=57577 RepID=A0ACB0JM12_TRIPR|nr:unnamed protein product [Trifolium pratense]